VSVDDDAESLGSHAVRRANGPRAFRACASNGRQRSPARSARSALEALDRLEVTRQRRERWVTVASKLTTARLYHPAQEAGRALDEAGAAFREMDMTFYERQVQVLQSRS
jgi:hypothetical protein